MGVLKAVSIKATYTAETKAGPTPLYFHELGDGGANAFHEAITSTKRADKFGAAVTAYSVEDYTKMRLFLTDDGMVGFALKGNDIVSVFKHPNSTAKQAAASILALAIAQGGERLDCFDTALPTIYSQSDFKAVARLAFDPKCQPEGWDKHTFKQFNNGHPDVVFMIYDPAHGQPYKSGDGKVVTDYDAGTKAQADALKMRATLPALTPAFLHRRSVHRTPNCRSATILSLLAEERTKIARRGHASKL